MSREFANPVFTHVTKTGLRYILLRPGTGTLKSPNVAILQYVLCGTSGAKIEASQSPGGFSIGQREVIRGFEEAVLIAGRNGMIDAYLPYQIAYGTKGAPPVIKPKMTLLFAIRVTGSAPIALSTILRRAFERGGDPVLQRAYKTASGRHFAGMYASEDDLQNAGYILTKHKKYDVAIALLKIEIVRFPKSGDTYSLLGAAYRRAGRRQEAIAAYSTALRLNSKDKDAAAALKSLQTGT